MFLYFSILICSTFIAQLAQTVKSNPPLTKRLLIPKMFLITCFCILIFFSAIRYKVAIDYTSYEEIFDKIRKGYIVHTEIGFNIVIHLLQKLTYDHRLIFAFFSFLTLLPVYKVIQKRSNDWGMSVFLFISLGYYFYSYQNIRQYLSYTIALFALDKLIDKKYLQFIFCSIIGASFHKSGLIILPAYLMSQVKLSTAQKLVFIFSGFICIKCRGILRKIIFLFYPSYEGSIYDQISFSYKNILICICFLTIFTFCCYQKKKNRETIMLENLCLFSIYLYLFCWWIPQTSRIGYFLLIPVCILLPNILTLHQNIRQKLLIKICIYTGGILLFYVLLLDAYSPTLKLLPYRTWINFL